MSESTDDWDDDEPTETLYDVMGDFLRSIFLDRMHDYPDPRKQPPAPTTGATGGERSIVAVPPAPGEVRLTTDEAAWIRTWLEPLDQWSSPMAKQIAAKMDAAAAPGER